MQQCYAVSKKALSAISAEPGIPAYISNFGVESNEIRYRSAAIRISLLFMMWRRKSKVISRDYLAKQ